MCFKNWLVTTLCAASMSTAIAAEEPSPITLAIHGGAGTLTREAITEDQERRIRDALSTAALAGYEVLEDGGAALDAITAAILVLEDAPEFNAGRGAVLTAE
ncbi:MAG: isoaspartyl peptidase/L-asparaginase, partial [Wenzhouxiangellaceae bacterium]